MTEWREYYLKRARINEERERDAQLAEYEQERRRSMLHLEAAICSLLHTALPHEAASILRKQADILEAYE